MFPRSRTLLGLGNSLFRLLLGVLRVLYQRLHLRRSRVDLREHSRVIGVNYPLPGFLGGTCLLERILGVLAQVFGVVRDALSFRDLCLSTAGVEVPDLRVVVLVGDLFATGLAVAHFLEGLPVLG